MAWTAEDRRRYAPAIGGMVRRGVLVRLAATTDDEYRRFIEAVLWIVRTGSPWRDLPAHFGNWSTAFRRFSDWRKADVFVTLFQACSDEPDLEYAMVDATIVKVHRHGQGAKGGLRARP